MILSKGDQISTTSIMIQLEEIKISWSEILQWNIRGKFGMWFSRWPLSGARDSYLYRPTELRARANAWPRTDLAPKRLNKSTRTTQPKSSKAPSDTERKVLKFVMVMIGKWFDHHFSLFFQGLALTHKKLALTLAVNQRTWRNFHQIF